MRKLTKILLIILSITLFIGVIGCSNVKTGYEDNLKDTKDVEDTPQVVNWVVESINFNNAEKNIQKVYEKVNLDYKPLMYIGYKYMNNAIEYAFTVEHDNVERLIIISQKNDKNKTLEVKEDTEEFDLLEFFTN